jgi:MFS transporter, DHA1 family, inner membrane transport protein
MRRTPLAIWAMVIAAFAMGADEFIVAGVIKEIAEDLQVTIGAVGGFESAYAIGVAVGAPLFTALGTRVQRRRMLLSTATVFVVGNAISALGPTYQTIMVGRIISAMAHGAFFGIAAVFAAELVDQARKGRAIATIFAGATAATVLGAPLGAAVGRLLGWRFTFWSLVIFGGLALLGLIALLPRHAGRGAPAPAPTHDDRANDGHAAGYGHGLAEEDLEGLDAHARMHAGAGGHTAPLRDQLRTLKRGTVWLAIATTMLGYGGVFTSYTYIAPQLTDVTGFDPVWITPLLLLFGAGLFVGNYLGGRLADAKPMPTLIGTIATLALVLFAMPLALETMPTAVAGLFLFGAAAFSVVAPLQLRVVTQAGDAPDVASALNISAFTLGSAIGIYLGGWAIDGGLGLTSVNWIGGLITLAGLVLALISQGLDRRAATTASQEHQAHAAHAMHHH